MTVPVGMSRPVSRLRFSLALVAALASGLMLGVAAGAPAMVERAALVAIGGVERRFGVRLDAADVEWSWGGGVVAHEVRVRDPEGGLLATLARVEVAADADLLARRVTVQSIRMDGVTLAFALRADGSTNLDGLLRGLARREGGDAPALPGSRLLTGLAPEVEVRGLRVVADLSPSALPAGLQLPSRIGLSGGSFIARPVSATGERPALRDADYSVAVTFSDLSLDPGHGLSLDLEGGLARGLSSVHVDFSRPVRMPIRGRLLSVGGAGWARETATFEVRELRLSQPLPDDPAVEVPAALAIGRVAIAPLSLDTILARAREGRIEALRAALLEAMGPGGTLTLESPVAALAIDDEGRHSFGDLIPAASAPPPEAPGREVGAVEKVGSASKSRAPLAVAVGAAFDRGMARAERLLAVAGSALGRLGEATPRVRVVGGRLLMHLRGSPLSLGEIALAYDRDAAAQVLTSSARLSGDAEGKLSLSLRRERDSEAGYPVSFGLAIEGLSAPALRADLGGPGRRVRLGPEARLRTLTVDLRGGGGGGEGGPLEGRVHVDAAGLELELSALADTPLVGLDAELGAHVAWDPAAGLLRIDELVARRGRVRVSGDLDVLDPRGTPKLKLALSLAPVPVQEVFEAIPPELVKTLRGLRMRGELSWALNVTLDTARIEDILLDSRPLLTGFAVEDLGRVLDFSRLRGALPYGIRLSDGSPGTRFVGPMTAAWVPLERIPRWLPQALMTTEDGTFEHHDGISTLAIRESIIENLKRGAFVRGASTITQQLVKNLWLGGDKHLSRKLQELFIAWRLSAELSKDEIMALYLNTIEFGPGLYGIGDAAYHWFGKRPEALNLAECIFLASIIPSPRRYHSFFEAGAITPRWESYLKMLLGVMHKRGRITEEELAAADVSRLRFRSSPDFGREDGPVFDTPPDREDPAAFGEDDAPASPPADDWDGDLLHRP